MPPPPSSPVGSPALFSRFRNGRSAFTLVEVTLAIGIVAVAILSMTALMPVGLRTMKESADSAVTAQILNKVASTVQTTPFKDLDDLIRNGPLLFDRAGCDVYDVEKAFFSVTLTTNATSFPGAPNDLSPASAQTLEIHISALKPGTTNAISSSKSAVIIPKS